MVNVFSIKTGKLLEEEQTAALMAEAEADEEFERALTEEQTRLITILNQAKDLVENGRLEGFVMMGRDPMSGLFYTEVALRDPFVTKNDLYAYIGCLEAIKVELSDAAMMAPAIIAGGVIVDPEQEEARLADEAWEEDE